MHIYNTSFPNFENFQGIEALAFATTIKVLIIDHKKDYLASVANFLQSFSFEVTPVDYAASALAILSERKDKFDIVLLDSDLSDVDTATFLRLTTNMDLLAVVMCEEDEDAILSRAFMNGAFLVVKRLLTIDVVRIMRQHAIRERINKLRRSKTASTIGEIAREEMPVFENSSHTCKGKSIDEPRKYVRKGSLDKNQASQSTENDGNNVRKKVCTEWTDELHGKFMNAINQLGEGRCYPKEILELMNVPGLTRMQVASHLQKCRNERWKVPEKRKAQILSRNQVFSGKRCQQRSMIRKFGSMPILPENPNDHHANNTLFDTIFSNGGKQIDENPMNHQIENSLQSMNIHGLQNPGQDRPDAISGSGIIFNGSGGNIQEANNQQESFTSTVSKTTNHYYAQLSSGFPGVTHGRNIPDISSSIRYLSEHFLDFRQEIRIPEQAPPDQTSNPEQHASSNYNQVSSDQNSGRDRSKKCQWGEGTSNFGGKYPSDEESA